ncbi:MAG: ATP-binding protein [Lachnospiraceae bacterium]|nr:ATP-binding protein [Lachnospiraceae bacterium]
MYHYKIGICGGDFHYNLKLMEYLNGHEDIPLKAAVFSTEAAVEEYTQGNNLDMLLVGGEKPETERDIPIAFLLEQRNVGDGIYKYQSADTIGKSIMDMLGRRSCVKESSWICIYSPIGRCGKTTLAKCICKYLTGSLYIDLEDYISCMPREDELKDGELFMYYLASESEEIIKLLKRLGVSEKNREGYIRLIGTITYLDRQINFKMLSWLKALMEQEKFFKNVVVDMGTTSLTSLQMLDIFDRVIVPYKGDETSMCKLNNFKRLIKERMGKEVEKKMKYIELTSSDIAEEDIGKLIL